MPSVTLGRLTALVMLATLAACSGQTPAASGFTPAATPANTHSVRLSLDTSPNVIPGGTGKCPGKDIACLTVSYKTPAHYTFCFLQNGSQCELPPLTWSWKFTMNHGQLFHKLAAVFTPNPGDPSTDEISEKVPLPSSNGAVKYQQTSYGCLPSGCFGPYNIGIITQ
jgi:hypothetical protein